MELSINKSRILLLTEKELKTLNGGGKFWRWFGEKIGQLKNAAEDYYENWMEMPAMPY